jgi:hypothetical protein
MKLDQAIQIVREFQRDNNIPTLLDTLNELGAIAHKLPLDLYVAKDIVAWGHSSHSCPTIAVGAIPANFFFSL